MPPPISRVRSRPPGLAVACLVLGILGLACSLFAVGGVLGLIGLGLGLASLRRRRTAMAGWGVVINALAVLVAASVIGFAAWTYRKFTSEDDPLEFFREEHTWKTPATHTNAWTLGQSPETRSGSLAAFCLDCDENVVACDASASCIRVIATNDTLVAKWDVPFRPEAVAWSPDRTVLVAGRSRVARIGRDGKVLTEGTWGVASEYVASVAAVSNAVLVCARDEQGFDVYRLEPNLTGARRIVQGLQGCCGQMDVTADGHTIYVAANCDAAVLKYDLDGKKVGSIRKKADMAEEVFEGCCEPKNVCVGPGGNLYVAESDRKVCFRFSPDGDLLDRVGVLPGRGSCVDVSVAVSRDGNRVYMLDAARNEVQVLVRDAP